jgi:uncharacterized coiled-coil protein SlyX
MSIPHDEGQRSDRLTDLELLFMHLERQVAELNQMVLEQGRKIELLERELRRQRDAEAQADDEPADDQPGDGAAWS